MSTIFERKSDRVASLPVFIRRSLYYFALSATAIFVALLIGVAGYHWIAGLAWLDALENASMILSGMGPVAPLSDAGAKVFASFYALFSGLVFVVALGLVLSPLAHRLLHAVHEEEHDE